MTEITYNAEQFIPIFLFLMFTFWIIMAEWKKDFIYFTLCIIFSIELGIQTLNMNDINIIISLSLFVVAGYYSILAIGYIPFLKPYFVWFRDYLDMD